MFYMREKEFAAPAVVAVAPLPLQGRLYKLTEAIRYFKTGILRYVIMLQFRGSPDLGSIGSAQGVLLRRERRFGDRSGR